jgi:ABC-type transport system involved in multi-copper enzyme maturation permease subunit
MTGLVRSEWLKQRSTHTSLALLAAMVGLISAVVLLHMISLSVPSLSNGAGQLKVFGLGTTFGTIFASLLGAMSVTSEIRHGTIRPTFLASPNRARVIAAKVAASAAAGAGFGLLAETLAAGVGSAALAARGIDLAPSIGQYAQLLAGGAVAAALWAAIGVGIGAIVRNQVGAVIGLVVWLLFIELTLSGSIPAAAKYAPGATAGAIAGASLEHTASDLVAPAVGAAVTVAYAAAATAGGLIAARRRDVS